MIKLLIVDDHPIVLAGTKKLFDDVKDMDIRTVSDSKIVMSIIEQQEFDIYLLDINMPNLSGIDLIKLIKKRQPNARIILYTGYDIRDYYSLVIEKNINGILSKTASKEEILYTIRLAMHNRLTMRSDFLDFIKSVFISKKDYKVELTEKEKQILKFLVDGYPNKAIASELDVTQRTVERYLTQLFTVLKVTSRIGAVELAKEQDLI
ncbi:hypothetical protein ACZ11_06880 [Lysinibacillus xylanilyticus]|uniref:DNA-binding response regulator n=1 Tax=Lysinibacillus xylanilyticus TaxID=582475 RepID=A0A0K9FBD2_9BACI|nr:response regulator transcription factor [Lysinibacillus xylanilyticus]KMY31904.1 hypothetical protein ACZ11_06880 [Lysinibacillus xylanilyticus]